MYASQHWNWIDPQWWWNKILNILWDQTDSFLSNKPGKIMLREKVFKQICPIIMTTYQQKHIEPPRQPSNYKKDDSIKRGGEEEEGKKEKRQEIFVHSKKWNHVRI